MLIVLGQFGTIYWTHDGGENWQLDSNAAILYQQPATLYPCILGENTALIADFRGRILRGTLKPTDVEKKKKKIILRFRTPDPNAKNKGIYRILLANKNFAYL